MRSFSHYEILLVNFIVDVFASRGDFVNDIWNLTLLVIFRASFMTVSTYLIYTAPPVDFCLITLSPVDAYSVVPIYSLFILKFDSFNLSDKRSQYSQENLAVYLCKIALF